MHAHVLNSLNSLAHSLRLLLDLGANPNLHGWGVKGRNPNKVGGSVS